MINEEKVIYQLEEAIKKYEEKVIYLLEEAIKKYKENPKNKKYKYEMIGYLKVLNDEILIEKDEPQDYDQLVEKLFEN